MRASRMRRMRPSVLVLLLVLGLGGAPPASVGSQQSAIPTPGEFFGRTIGAAGVLIPHSEILRYYEVLAERTDRVQLRQVGRTTELRPFYYALVSSPENLARLDELIEANDKLYDPRGVGDEEAQAIIASNPSFVIVNGQIHSTEVGASQGGILLAHRLATGTDAEVEKILKNVVIAHVPVHNPDGQEMVYEWLDRYRGTEHENSQPPFLYQKYVGHDNNRDWYMFTQVETRLSIQMQNLLHPQFTLDQHQQGSTGSRIFVPPFEDPWEPNVDPAIQASNNMIGAFMGQYLTARDYAGVEWKQRYDAWTPARAYYHTHGGVRILTEVASANFADDIEIPFEAIGSTHQERHWYFPMPWQGGTWRFSEVVDYHYTSAMAALRAAADLREHLLAGMYAAQRRSVEPDLSSDPPFAFVLPANQVDPPVTAKLLKVLQIADVDIERAGAAFRAGGRDYAAGSHIVRFAQPAGRFAKSVLERQEYPQLYLYEGGPLDPPYDVTAHTLPMLMNVRVDRVDAAFDVAAELVETVMAPAGGLVEPAGTDAAVAYLMDPQVNNSYSVAAAMGGRSLSRSTRGFEAAGRAWPAGTWIQQLPAGADGILVRQELAATVRKHHVRAFGVARLPGVAKGWVGPPAVGIYQSYVASMPEGWLRFVLDQHQIPFEVLHDDDIRAGDLARFGVIFVPDNSSTAIVDGRSATPSNSRGRQTAAAPPQYAGGLGEEGVAMLRAYVEEGGTVFTWGRATGFASQHLGASGDSLGTGLSRTEFNIPGSLLRVEVDVDHPLGFGLTPETPIFYWNSPFWSPAGEQATSVATYPSSDLLLSGWIQGEERLAGNSALLENRVGQGRVIRVGFSPEYRAQAHHTFKVIFNAIFPPQESD